LSAVTGVNAIEIAYMVVSQMHRRRGHGRHLVEHVLERARKHGATKLLVDVEKKEDAQLFWAQGIGVRELVDEEITSQLLDFGRQALVMYQEIEPVSKVQSVINPSALPPRIPSLHGCHNVVLTMSSSLQCHHEPNDQLQPADHDHGGMVPAKRPRKSLWRPAILNRPPTRRGPGAGGCAA